MSPFQGQSPAPERPGNSFNSLLRRLRPTNELRRSPQPRCKNSINSNLRRERPERATSSQPRATPWVSAYKRQRPVRAKVWANGCFILLPLQGEGVVRTLTQGVALGSGLVGLSARARPPVCPEPAAPAPLKGAHISNLIAGQAPPTICAPYRGRSESR